MGPEALRPEANSGRADTVLGRGTPKKIQANTTHLLFVMAIIINLDILIILENFQGN